MDFHTLEPTPNSEILDESELNFEDRREPLSLSNDALSKVAVYLPTGGKIAVDLSGDEEFRCRWYNPRTGEMTEARENSMEFSSPSKDEKDWVLFLEEGA